jgi:F-type H+-transporting ATPase subunit delta
MARPGTAARRYAEAGFEIASRDDTHEAWRDDLLLAARFLSHPDAARIVESPAVPIAARRALVDRLLEGRVARPVHNLVRLLTDRGRTELLPGIAEQYQRLLNRHRGIIEAVVTTAMPLTPDELQAVRSRIETMAGSKIDLSEVVDESLIGGLTVRVGDRLLDASVRGRLERLRDQLIAGTR